MNEKIGAPQKELGVFHGEVNVSKIVLVLILTGLSRNQTPNGNASWHCGYQHAENRLDF